MIRVFSDSTSDLSDELIEKYNITIVPLYIILGEEQYKDRVEITPEKIYEWSEANNTTPKTAAVSMEDACDQMKAVLDRQDEIIVFSISGQMSSTGNVFRLAAEELGAEDRVSVIDSGNLSTGIGLQIVAACEYLKQGKSRQETVEYIQTLIPKVRASFVVDTLTYLYRGGRCSAVAALAGGMLKLHPEIVVKDGAMGPSRKYRGKIDSAILKYAEDLKEDLLNAVPDRVFITHSGCDAEVVGKVYDYLKELNIFSEIHITRAGGVISSHCGPGTLGILFIAK